MNVATGLNLPLPMDSVEKWYQAATVRNAPRIMVPPSTSVQQIFPRSRHPMVDHPIITARGEAVSNFILTQSAYKYMYEIGLLETRYVMDCGLNIVNNKITSATDDDKCEALTVVIDEGYHAYVALDFIVQMKQATGIAPVEIPASNGNLDAVTRAYQALPEPMHHDFQLISVCLAEHTLTTDLVAIGRERDMTQSFSQVMTDHVADEARHAGYFARMVKSHWLRMAEPSRIAIGELLPAYLDDYLAGDTDRLFDRKVLAACGLQEHHIAQVIEDTNPQYLASMNGYIAKTTANLVRLIKRVGILDHPPTHDRFVAHGTRL